VPERIHKNCNILHRSSRDKHCFSIFLVRAQIQVLGYRIKELLDQEGSITQLHDPVRLMTLAA